MRNAIGGPTLDDTEILFNENGYPITYDAIILACGGVAYTMSLTDDEDVLAVVESVNEGIDSRLQACNVEGRGDDYHGGKRGFTATEDGARWKAGDFVTVASTLECSVSPQSLPVLLRRMFERDASLAASILYSLGFAESGEFIGRDD
jgi:hypothetical protein